MVMASPNPIPPNATLLDNGASVNVMKTLTGAILSTYVPDEPGDGISVGRGQDCVVAASLAACLSATVCGAHVQRRIRTRYLRAGYLVLSLSGDSPTG